MGKRASGKRPGTARRYWLLKSDPLSYAIDDLAAAPGQCTSWDGVRNYQARNMLRDEIQVGDRAFFYHSGVPPLAIVGTVEVINPAYPDPTAFDPSDHHYDPKSSRENPTWYAVDIKLLTRFPEPVSRDDLKGCRELRDMMLLQRGSRLSVQPVTMAEWMAVHRLVGIKDM